MFITFFVNWHYFGSDPVSKPESKESWNNLHSGKQIKSAPAFSNCAGMQSGPQALHCMSVAV